MKKEIDVALDLLLAYVQRFGSIKDQTMEQFRSQLEQILLERYQGHWYPGTAVFSSFSNARILFVVVI